MLQVPQREDPRSAVHQPNQLRPQGGVAQGGAAGLAGRLATGCLVLLLCFLLSHPQSCPHLGRHLGLAIYRLMSGIHTLHASAHTHIAMPPPGHLATRQPMQVLVDLGTTSAVLDQLRAAGEGVIRANPTEFNGTLAVNLREGGGPLKVTISTYWWVYGPALPAGDIGSGGAVKLSPVACQPCN